MKISTEIASAAKHVGEQRAVELYGKAGFDAWDLSLFSMAKWSWERNEIIDTSHPLRSKEYLSFVRELKKIGEAYGMVCNQSHAPFPTKHMTQDILKRAIECTAEAGGKICIIHPDNDASAERNAELYNALLPFAKEHGVKIATENMWNWDRANGAPTSSPAACSTSADFVAHIDAVDDPYFVACLDLGHAEMRGSGDGAPQMIRALGHRLEALHIHDNDRLHDSHQIPFSMDIDFSAVVDALKDVGYSGYLTLEADQYLSAYNSENLFEGIKNLYDSARRLANMF